MKITSYETEQDWLEARRGKITGTRLKDLIVKRGTGKKLGFYELIAERLAIPADDENKMERGKRLECEALDRLEKETGLKFVRDLVIWTRDDNGSIAISPDGFTEDLTIGAETKCLGSAYHIKALLENKIPSEYWEQALQYFIVNDDLKELYFTFYDNRIVANDFLFFIVKREEVAEQIAEYKELERKTLEEVDEIVLKLSNF